MSGETLETETVLGGRVHVVRFNRPDVLNAFNKTTAEELIGAIDSANDDDTCRAIVVTGAGKAFCAGADLGPGGSKGFSVSCAHSLRWHHP